MTPLATRCEAAGAGEQRALLEEVYVVLFPFSVCWDFDEGQAHFAKEHKFATMLDAEAYLSAAEMLVPIARAPELLREAIGHLSEKYALHMRHWPKDKNYWHELALALAAASLRAKGENND